MAAPTPNPPPLPPIAIVPASTPDFYPIATLEARVFYPEEFSAVAFGPTRDSPSNLKLREKTLASQPKEKGAENVVTKVVVIVDSKEEIIGAAGWSFHLGKEDGTADAGKEEKEDEDRKGEELENGVNGWGEGANVKLCEDVFLGAERHMGRATEGRNYASEFYVWLSSFPSLWMRMDS
jgi:hypothetical protein